MRLSLPGYFSMSCSGHLLALVLWLLLAWLLLAASLDLWLWLQGAPTFTDLIRVWLREHTGLAGVLLILLVWIFTLLVWHLFF